MGDVQLDPYLFFKGNAREALDFYKSVFGGDVEISEYTEKMVEAMPEDAKIEVGKIMHGLLSGGAIRLMCSDSINASPEPKKIELALSGEDEAILHGIFNKLADGGKIRMPLEKAPWGDVFGMVTDKFNIEWMVNVVAAKG